MTATLVDLQKLPAPVVVEQLDYETILAAMLADLRERDATFDALVESDPVYKILEVAAYRETVIRQRVNDAAHSVMVAYAAAGDLDQLGANLGVERLLVDEGDPDATPPVPPTYETDERLRLRIVSALEGYSVAGPQAAYQYHALSASALVSDARATSPNPGEVQVVILSTEGTGEASVELINTVRAALSEETVRPLTDQVSVLGATIETYTIDATLYLYPGPEVEPVIAAATAAVEAYATAQRRIGRDIRLSALYAALHVEGVQRVELTSPAADIVISATQAAYCTDISVVYGDRDE